MTGGFESLLALPEQDIWPRSGEQDFDSDLSPRQVL